MADATLYVMKAVRDAIEEVRPDLQADGGDIELVSVTVTEVVVKVSGACAVCHSLRQTADRIARLISQRAPSIQTLRITR
jgi:Fe-S cluster biogenesis protein NfuA